MLPLIAFLGSLKTNALWASLGSLAKCQSKNSPLNSPLKLVFVRQLVRSLTQLDQVLVSMRDKHLNNQATHQLRLWLDWVKVQHATSNAITLLPYMDVIGEWCCNWICRLPLPEQAVLNTDALLLCFRYLDRRWKVTLNTAQMGQSFATRFSYGTKGRN